MKEKRQLSKVCGNKFIQFRACSRAAAGDHARWPSGISRGYFFHSLNCVLNQFVKLFLSMNPNANQHFAEGEVVVLDPKCAGSSERK